MGLAGKEATMSRTVRVLWMVLGGLVGGYLGYWLGHLAGWSTDADWPLRIGGGAGAIAVSIGLAVLGVLCSLALIELVAARSVRRLRANGATATALVVDRWALGTGLRSGRREYGFLVETRLPDGTVSLGHATEWLTTEKAAELLPHRQVAVRYHPRRVVVEAPVSASVSSTV
jgi:hypothetical protein